MKCSAMSHNLEINELEDGRYIVFNKISKKTYTLGKSEYNILMRLDGMTSISEIAEETNCPEEKIQSLINVFDKIKMLDTSDIKGKIDITKLSYRVLNPNKIFKSKKFVRIISSILLYGTLPLLIFAIAMNVFLHKNLADIYLDIIASVQSPSVFVTIPIILIVTFLHEMGHAMVAKRYGVNVPELGVMLYWFIPTAYVNMTGITLLKSKKEKLLAYFGGIIMNIMILAIVLLMRPFIGDGAQFIISWFVMDTLMSVIFNLFIFLKLDGYLVLKEMVEIPDLREKAFQYIRESLMGLFTDGMQGLTTSFQMQVYESNYTAMEKAIFICYGLLSMLYIPILVISIFLCLMLTIFS